MPNTLKYELQNILSGKIKVKSGDAIQAIASYLRRSKETGTSATGDKHFKNEETEKLILWINDHDFWYNNVDVSLFVSEGAEQKVYLKDEKFVVKLNDSIYYSTWLDYFYNLLLNNYFFEDTAYELLGFYEISEVLYAVVQQRFVKSNEYTDLENVKKFMVNNGFRNTRNNDYLNPELGVILEDLHDENVLTENGILYFIDTVFYLTENFWK